jgi:hypothetical protein
MSDFKPTLKQIELYKELRKITEPHHMYADQIMAIAEYIDAEFIHKSKANGVNTSERQLTIPDVSNQVCQHQKRQWIPELNKDLCLNCGTLI